MDIDPLELADDNEETKDKAKSRLNAMVAITIALLATFMGICKVKDDNICQAMQQAQAKSLDAWGTFHAKSTEAKLLDAAATELELSSANPKAAPAIKRFRAKQAEQLKEKDEWQKTAQGAQTDYDSLNYRDDHSTSPTPSWRWRSPCSPSPRSRARSGSTGSPRSSSVKLSPCFSSHLPERNSFALNQR